jgi:Transposase DDE domain
MLFLHHHNIVDLYCWVDDQIDHSDTITTGRPRLLNNSELLTILIWNTCTLRQKTLKDIYQTLHLYHEKDFQKIPSYQTFVRRAHQELPLMFELLEQLLCDTEPVRILDATMLPVSKPHRADRHKVAKDIAAFGKNWQGWHYGFKLHASTNLDGRLCAVMLTGANVYDAQAMPKLLNQHCRLAVGDTLYGAKVMGKIIRDNYGTVIIAPPWPTQKQKVSTPWQIDLLNQRSKIECIFDYLKEHLHLVTSFPRSVRGYVLHYVRILLGYQIMALSKVG